MAGRPTFVTVRVDDLIAVLDDPDSPARFKLNDALAAAWAVAGGAQLNAADQGDGEATEPFGAFVLVCTACDTECRLPYLDEARTEVSIVGCDGWTMPPYRCPACSAPSDAPLAPGDNHLWPEGTAE